MKHSRVYKLKSIEFLQSQLADQMRKMAQFCIYILISLSCTILLKEVEATPVSNNLKVTLNHGGVLVGRYMKSAKGRDIREFLGIPYAKPPIGELRLSAPVPPDSWEGERQATTDGNICSQMVLSSTYAGDEDCLYLNVYTPLQPRTSKPLPVMVWIPGGGFAEGDGTSASFSPKRLLDRDIILVSMNYRLSVMGFLSSETLDIPGNFGLKDQLMALKWVQEHISAFGGDPNSVTIFGQSAGGASVAYHTLTEKSSGLFHRGIAQSGSCYNSWAEPAPKGHAADVALKIAESLACNKEDWQQILTCLRSVSAQNLTESYISLLVWDYAPLSLLSVVVEPEHEGAYLTHPLEVTAYSNSMPLMIGFTEDEGITFVQLHEKAAANFTDMRQKFEANFLVGLDLKYVAEEDQASVEESIKQFYFKNGILQDQNLTDSFSDSHFIRGIDEHIKHRTSTKYPSAPTYVYQFQHKGQVSNSMSENGTFQGVAHGDDLLYLYPTAEIQYPSVPQSERDEELTENMLDLWYNFAAVGNPTPDNTYLLEWKENKSYPPKTLRIGSKNEVDKLLEMTEEYPTSRMQFWQNLESSQELYCFL